MHWKSVECRKPHMVPAMKRDLVHLESLFQGFAEAVDAFFLFGEAGVDVEVEGGGDGRMAEDDGDGFIVAAACDAAGGETVPEGVETDIRDIKPPEQAVEIIAIGPRFHRGRSIGYEEIFRRHNLLQGPDNAFELRRERYFPYRRTCLGGIHRYVIFTYSAVGDGYALDRLIDTDNPERDIKVLPLQAAHLPDTETAVEAQHNAEIPV